MSAFSSTAAADTPPPPHLPPLYQPVSPLHLPLPSHSTVAQWTAPTAISHHYHLPSWATASHYHAALLIFLSYQLANHKPLSLMARFGVRRYSFCRSNLARESFGSPDDRFSLPFSFFFSPSPCPSPGPGTGEEPSVSSRCHWNLPRIFFKSLTQMFSQCQKQTTTTKNLKKFAELLDLLWGTLFVLYFVVQ